MPSRSDVYVIESVTPRLVVVESPSTEITVQDLLDTLRDWEDEPINMDADQIVKAAGKDDLGGGVKVGITITLLNAQLMFESRTTEIDNGTCSTADSNGENLIDSSATFVTDGVYAGCTVWNHTTESLATILEVVSETELRHFALSGGSRDDWQVGDSYSVYPNVQCNVSGGNLVALDETGNSISPIAPSANVQVVRTSSSSATLQELQDIQFSSFEGGVTVDVGSSYSGTTYPTGTRRQPVNNLSDALTIAAERGLGTFYILGDITLDNSLNFTQYSFIGESPSKSTITVASDANTYKCEFYECTLEGTLDGQCKVKNSVINDVNYISGYVELCVLQGNITLGGGASAYFLDCWAGTELGSPPSIDLGGSGQTLVMQNFNGYIKWKNKSGTDQANASLNAGWIVLENTITNGDIIIIGTGYVEDNSTGSANVNTTYLVNPGSVADATWDEAASSHTTSGSFGELLAFLSDTEGGRWKIDTSANQMIFYKSDNSTEIMRFNLYDKYGQPASENVFERQRV